MFFIKRRVLHCFNGVLIGTLHFVPCSQKFVVTREAETFAKEQCFDTKDLEEIALKICQLPKQNEDRPRICIITHGHEPVILAKDGKITKYPVAVIPDEKIIDTNGAGDAFCGGFLSQYIQGQDLSTCIKCGCWAAAQIVQRSGCTYEGKASFRP